MRPAESEAKAASHGEPVLPLVAGAARLVRAGSPLARLSYSHTAVPQALTWAGSTQPGSRILRNFLAPAACANMPARPGQCSSIVEQIA